MNRFLSLLLAALFICCASVCVSAQDSQTLFSQIERASQEREPKWKIHRKIVTPKYVSVWWKAGKPYVRASIQILSSEKAAADTFEGFDSEISEGCEVSVTSGYSKTEIPNLGDKNYLWSHRKGGASILFRKGNVFVLLIAPSVEAAKSFAQLVAEQLPAT